MTISYFTLDFRSGSPFLDILFLVLSKIKNTVEELVVLMTDEADSVSNYRSI